MGVTRFLPSLALPDLPLTLILIMSQSKKSTRATIKSSSTVPRQPPTYMDLDDDSTSPPPPSPLLEVSPLISSPQLGVSSSSREVISNANSSHRLHPWRRIGKEKRLLEVFNSSLVEYKRIQKTLASNERAIAKLDAMIKEKKVPKSLLPDTSISLPKDFNISGEDLARFKLEYALKVSKAILIKRQEFVSHLSSQLQDDALVIFHTAVDNFKALAPVHHQHIIDEISLESLRAFWSAKIKDIDIEREIAAVEAKKLEEEKLQRQASLEVTIRTESAERLVGTVVDKAVEEKLIAITKKLDLLQRQLNQQQQSKPKKQPARPQRSSRSSSSSSSSSSATAAIPTRSKKLTKDSSKTEHAHSHRRNNNSQQPRRGQSSQRQPSTHHHGGPGTRSSATDSPPSLHPPRRHNNPRQGNGQGGKQAAPPTVSFSTGRRGRSF